MVSPLLFRVRIRQYHPSVLFVENDSSIFHGPHCAEALSVRNMPDTISSQVCLYSGQVIFIHAWKFSSIWRCFYYTGNIETEMKKYMQSKIVKWENGYEDKEEKRTHCVGYKWWQKNGTEIRQHLSADKFHRTYSRTNTCLTHSRCF